MLSLAVVLAVACLILSCDVASAATPVTTDAILDRFHAEAIKIGNKIEEYAVWLFWCLAIIEFSWAAIQVGVRGEMSLGALWSMVFKQTMMIGFFWWLLRHWPTLANNIVGGLGQDLANKVGGSDFSPADILSKGVQALWLNIDAGWKAGWSDFAVGILAGVVIFLAFSLAAAALCVYTVEWAVGIPIGVLLLGMGGSSWTKSYVESYFRFLVSLGLKILSVKIILMIVMEYLDELIIDLENDASNTGFMAAGATLASLSIIAYMLIQQVPGIASSMLSGASMQSGASTLASAVGGAAGNMKSVANAAQTAAQSATNAGAKMAGVAKAAGTAGAAASQKASSKVSSALGGGGGGGGLGSALRGAASGGAGALAGGAVAVGSVAKSAAQGAGRGIARWAGISTQEDPMQQMSRNVAAIANKLGVNDAPNENKITPGNGNSETRQSKEDSEDALELLQKIAQETNVNKGQGDAI